MLRVFANLKVSSRLPGCGTPDVVTIVIMWITCVYIIIWLNSIQLIQFASRPTDMAQPDKTKAAEQRRKAVAVSNRAARKARAASSSSKPATCPKCTTCGRQFRAKIGLVSHLRKNLTNLYRSRGHHRERWTNSICLNSTRCMYFLLPLTCSTFETTF